MATQNDPLYALQNWQPFRIDALGLVTMLGAEQLDRSIGRLTRNKFFEYFPLLSAFLISSDQITEPVPGFYLYNISDAIVTTELSGWLSRWLLSQNLRRAGTKLEWAVSLKPRSVWREELLALTLAMLATGPLMALALLIGDWFGFANVVAMLFSVITRWYVVNENRTMLDRAAAAGDVNQPDRVKLLSLLPDGKAVVMHAPRGIVIECFTRKPDPAHPRFYGLMRLAGWIAFAVHVIAIGMSVLVVQIYTVVLIVVASILTVYGVGSNADWIGRRLCVQREESWDSNRTGRRRDMYIDMDLSKEEEQLLLEWNLFPKKFNRTWWNEYREQQQMANEKRQRNALKDRCSISTKHLSNSSSENSVSRMSTL